MAVYSKQRTQPFQLFTPTIGHITEAIAAGNRERVVMELLRLGDIMRQYTANKLQTAQSKKTIGIDKVNELANGLFKNPLFQAEVGTTLNVKDIQHLLGCRQYMEETFYHSNIDWDDQAHLAFLFNTLNLGFIVIASHPHFESFAKSQKQLANNALSQHVNFLQQQYTPAMTTVLTSLNRFQGLKRIPDLLLLMHYNRLLNLLQQATQMLSNKADELEKRGETQKADIFSSAKQNLQTLKHNITDKQTGYQQLTPAQLRYDAGQILNATKQVESELKPHLQNRGFLAQWKEKIIDRLYKLCNEIFNTKYQLSSRGTLFSAKSLARKMQPITERPVELTEMTESSSATSSLNY